MKTPKNKPQSVIAALAITIMGSSLSAFAQTPWQQASNYPLATYQQEAVEYKGHVYVAGGYNGIALTSVYSAQFREDGSLSGWASAATLPEADQGPGLAVHNGWLYVALSSGGVHRAQVLPNGSLGAWLSEPSVQSSTAYRLGLKAHNGFLYLFGRYDGTHYNVVRTAPINPNGSLGAWTTGTMPQSRHHAAVHFVNGRVYLIGGITDGDSILSSVYSAPANANGTLGSWRPEQSLPSPLWYHSTVKIGTDIYLFGGFTNYFNTSPTLKVYRGQVNPGDGTVAGWAVVDLMPSEYVGGPGAVYAPNNGRVYLIGGGSANGFTAQVWQKPFAPAIINLRKAVYLETFNLLLGTNYQLQVSADLSNWNDQGTPFTATNSYWRSANYWDVENWNKLFFRFQAQ